MDKHEQTNTEPSLDDLWDILLALSTLRARTEAAGYDATHLRRIENRVRLLWGASDLEGLRVAS